jgi:hypothetical protein
MRILFQPDQYQTYQPPTPSIWQHLSDALQQSVYRVSSLLVNILPGLVAFLIAIALMTVVGIALSWVLRKILTAAKFDERMTSSRSGMQSSIADFSPESSPTALAGRVAFWACVLLGLAIGISTFDAVAVFSVSLLPYLSRLVGAALILFAGNLIARFLARTVLIGAVNNQLQYARFLSMGVKWLVLVLTAAMTLDHLQIGGNIIELAFGILFGGIVLTLALAVGLGSRDLVTRSLERNQDRMDRTPERTAAAERRDDFTTFPPPAKPEETLRHF